MKFNRNLYKEIKKMDRNEMESFFMNIYHEGLQDGSKSGNSADFKIKLFEVLNKTKGVGPKIIDNVMSTIKEMGL